MRATSIMNFAVDKDYARKTHHAIKKPDDFRAGLAAAEGNDVTADAVIQHSALVLVGLSRMSEGFQRDRKMDLQSAKCSR